MLRVALLDCSVIVGLDASAPTWHIASGNTLVWVLEVEVFSCWSSEHHVADGAVKFCSDTSAIGRLFAIPIRCLEIERRVTCDVSMSENSSRFSTIGCNPLPSCPNITV